jgi:hypothetical protein
MHLSQAKYAAKIQDKAGMTAYKSATTPVDTLPKIATAGGPPVAVPHLHAP